MIRAVVTHDLSTLVERSSLDSWKQVLAIITTHSDNKEFPVLAGKFFKKNNKISAKYLLTLIFVFM